MTSFSVFELFLVSGPPTKKLSNPMSVKLVIIDLMELIDILTYSSDVMPK